MTHSLLAAARIWDKLQNGPVVVETSFQLVFGLDPGNDERCPTATTIQVLWNRFTAKSRK